MMMITTIVVVVVVHGLIVLCHLETDAIDTEQQ
jgi:hypothetical protein